jgi:CRISPR-associated endoribonuclease Cas6
MRVHLNLTKPNAIIPFNHQEILVGVLHKWLGKNEIHDDISLYSFSRLTGAKQKSGGLDFPFGAKWFISIYDKELFKRLLNGIVSSPEVNWGMKVNDFMVQPEPDLTYQEHFLAASPIFIKRTIENRQKHYLFNEPETAELMKETLLHKMKKVGIEDPTLEILFDAKFSKPKTQKITYRGVENRASVCPVIIKAKPETKIFAWNVGVGNSTGIGFGAIQ